MYDPAQEHDACGVAFVADLTGRRDHKIVEKALTALRNLEHRGARGAEPDEGDGAGILIQIPDEFLREVVDFPLPAAGHYAVGTAFIPDDDEVDAAFVAEVERIAGEEGVSVLGWRDLPINPDAGVGRGARAVMPRFRQLFLAGVGDQSGLELERLVYPVRRRAEHACGVYFPSLSCRTLVYKGMLTEEQLVTFYPDLTDERVTSSLGLVHSRFSTNTFPAWPLAHPYRMVAHNGEINTVKGNRNWMRARESQLATDLIRGDLDRLCPIVSDESSDSASFDEVLELLHLGGRSMPHSVLMMIPEAWENHTEMDPGRRAFYEFHSTMMEPWDGPALIAFTDGSVIGAVLDRNGLRPARYWVTEDGLVVLASEVGVLDIDPTTVVRKGRLEPGRMFLADLEAGRIVGDDEIKGQLAAEHPYAEWVAEGLTHLDDLPEREREIYDHATLVQAQQSIGYTSEELEVLLAPMARTGAEPIGSMGNDAPLAPFSEQPRPLFDYFTQQFAQVTNPPLDAIREELVTSLETQIGAEPNLLVGNADSCKRIVLRFPVLSNAALAKIVHIDDDGDRPDYQCVTVRGVYKVRGGGAALRARLDAICNEVAEAVEDGARLVVLSNRGADFEHAAIPSLLLTGAVHHHLVRQKTRTQVGLLVEAADAREVHHIALLIGYGAAAVNPFLAMATVDDMVDRGVLNLDKRTATTNLIKALGKGVRKTMSKMGVSTVASYNGAQIFEAIGLGKEVVDLCFTGTTSRLGGVGFDILADEAARWHKLAFPADGVHATHRELATGGDYQWRREGEAHLFNPATVFKLQHSTRQGRYDIFKEYSNLVDDQSERLLTLRGLFGFREGVRPPVPIDEVEPISEIVKRFATGAISYGSISAEMHETLAIAMNRIGGKSNTGEGGEDADRFTPDENGDSRRSSIKQVASGRFGVTSHYLVNADDLQIKISQGAKPGEGGQLPGTKVYPWIAKTRGSTPGVGLISPPPHHDIYSIEDIKQLIHDLKNANPKARVHVKLVSEVGVGTVAAGVAKAYSDVVLISGHDGGTGASPLSSIKHAGTPWELGLAETQQTLIANKLRDRIVVQADGQLKTGRDVVIAALLGAEEYGFATAPLVVSGCIMMRVCHLDTCPVGVATQNPVLRAKFNGKPEFVVNFMEFVAQEVREYLAQLGFRTLEEAIGRTEMLDTRHAVEHWKASGLDLSPILHVPAEAAEGDQPRHCIREQDHGLEKALDNTLIQLAEGALDGGDPVRLDLPVRNVNRTVGTMLGHHLTKRWGAEGLPDNTIDITLTGTAGQSFGAFVPKGITLRLVGDANDYVGKGLSGGRITVRPHPGAQFTAEQNIIAGNTLLYGATSGELFLRGMVGERFCVRNSGALTVVEGVGDHGCEYMTGGKVVVLGPTGRNFAAGMSGGMAYLLDLNRGRINPEMVDIDPLDDDDREFLAEVVARHHAETGSAVARALLSDWDNAVNRFGKVMPKDFKRVLAARAAAERDGRDVNQAIMEASHG
jgi:glutamate synthase (NADPH/NADH) large chain